MAVTVTMPVDRLRSQLNQLAIQTNNSTRESQVFDDTTPEERSETPSPTTSLPSMPRTDLQLHFRVSAHDKSQHFSRRYEVWALSNGREAGQAQARYIDRPRLGKMKSKCLAKSLEAFNACDSDGLALALHLFNSDGSLQTKHRAFPWGNELSKGPMLVLGFLLVEREFRRRGVAGLLMSAVIEKARRTKGGLGWVFVKPNVVKADFGEEYSTENELLRRAIEKRAYETAVGFYRSFGFRRVGESMWYCLALDPEHVSRNT